MKFMKNTDKYQTHLSFNKGKYNVPDDKLDEFLKAYYNAMKSNVDLYLIEKIHDCNFAFFVDLDNPKTGEQLTDEDVEEIIKLIRETIEKMYNNYNDKVKVTVTKRINKYHLNYPNLIVNSKIAKTIAESVITKLNNKKRCIDTSVYRTGLRMLGSKKIEITKSQHVDKIYRLYNLETKTIKDISETTFSEFKETLIRRPSGTSITDIKDEFNELSKSQPISNKVNITGIGKNEINDEISRLLNELKSTSNLLNDYDMTISEIYARKNRLGMFCYFVNIKQKFCPFKQREHKRVVSPLYVEIGMNGVYVKCRDEDCCKRTYPEEGIRLPVDYAVRYSQLYLSMTTKYWTTEVNLTDEIRTELENSLNGSHYKIARAIFSIYKDRFRIDNVKNSSWYEYDGIRWNKSHIINILISEELPKYYRGIKISDTSVTKNENLKDYLVSNEVVDTNLRNKMVDAIISKLENVNFKDQLLKQVIYLYENCDPDFYSNLDSNPYLLAFKNGVYDFKTNTFRQSTQQDYIAFSTGYDYLEYDDNYIQIQEIYEFLSKIIPNQQVREYLLKILGKSLLGIPEEKFYIWTGLSGANGKSTLVNFLEATLGDYITSVDVSLLTNKRASSSSASPDIVRLKGKRLFTFQEPEHDDKLRTGILKQYTGGDTIIARELFKAPVTFKLQGTMLMCCNDLPSVSSIDGGTWRRIRVIEFKSRFCDYPVKMNEFKIDPCIKTKIQEWRPYFMSILIHWYNKYLYEGLHEPDEVMRATNKYKVENDKFNEFFDECIEESNEFESNRTLYDIFHNWWNLQYPNTKTPDTREFRRALKLKYGDEKETFIHGSKSYGFNVTIKSNLSVINDDEY